MPLARLLPLSADANALLSTYGLQVEGESRIPNGGHSDATRTAVEEAFFPSYSSQIRFAALSINGLGQGAYGGCHVQFKDHAVSERASVFDSPLFMFVKKHQINLTDSIPPGYRGTWIDRGKVAVTKLGHAVDGMSDLQMGFALMPIASDTESDCIEVHIHGALSRDSISRVTMRPEVRRADRAIQQAVYENLQEANIAVEIQS